LRLSFKTLMWRLWRLCKVNISAFAARRLIDHHVKVLTSWVDFAIHHGLRICYYLRTYFAVDAQVYLMRPRATAIVLRQPLFKPGARTATTPVHLAKVQLNKTFFSPSCRSAQLRNTLSDVAFAGSSPPHQSPEECGADRGTERHAPDERTLKLGRSELPTAMAH